MLTPLAIPSRFETAEAVRAWLVEFRDSLAPENPHRQFVAAYSAMTDGILARHESGGFRDGRAVERYVIAFANRYVDALEAEVAGRSEEVPASWRLALDRDDGNRSPVLGLVLGASAHINHDLAFAVVEAGIDPSTSTHREDYAAIGRDAHALSSTCLGFLAAVDLGVARLHPWSRSMIVGAASYALRRGREVAWRSARRLVDGDSDPDRAILAEKIGRRAEAVGCTLLVEVGAFDTAAGVGRTWWRGLHVMACLRRLLR